MTIGAGKYDSKTALKKFVGLRRRLRDTLGREPTDAEVEAARGGDPTAAWLLSEVDVAIKNRAAWHRSEGRDFAAAALEKEAKRLWHKPT
jgi:hypothetical protein